jgi:hypothetical protein
MATSFPASLDTLTNPTSSDSLSSPSHSAQHANVNDAVEALQAKVGADSSAVTSSLDYKVAQLEAISHGKILQVVEATHSTHLTIASTSFTDTGLTATITPSAVTSKVFVIVSQPFAVFRQTNDYIIGSMQLVRDATNLEDYQAGTISAGTDTGGNILAGYTQAYTYLDSPATTSAVVYKTQAKAHTTANAGRIYANSDGINSRPSYITLLEVSA